MTPEIPRFNGIPALGFGTWRLSSGEGRAALDMALEVGFRHIDTAQMYGNEAEVGAAIAACGLKREEVFVTTKVNAANLGAGRFLPSVRESLDHLRLAQVDLLLIHWPPTDAKDIEPVMDRLNVAAEAGLAAHIGVSNFPVAYLRRAAARSARKLINNQVEFHPFLDQSKLKAAASELGITLTAYRPIARGLALAEPAIVAIANRLGEDPSSVVLAWILQQGVVAVPMTTKRAHAEANLRAVGIKLNSADMAAISALTRRNQRFVAPETLRALWDV